MNLYSYRRIRDWGPVTFALTCGLLTGVAWGGTVPSDLYYPSGTQSFENITVGDDVLSITDWVVVDTSPPGLFTILVANNPPGGPFPASTRWLRLTDTDGGNVQNRFYSNGIALACVQDYTWTWYVKLEQAPPGIGAAKPRFTIQHDNVGTFANAWGIEFADTGASLIVTGIGGVTASAPLYPIAPPTGVGDWVKLELFVRFSNNTVAASVNDGVEVSLPIALAGSASKRLLRFCYRGEGVGNVAQMLIDDVSFETDGLQCPAASPFGLVAAAAGLLIAGVAGWRRLPRTPLCSTDVRP